MVDVSVSQNNACDLTLDLKNGLIVKAGKSFAVRHKIFKTLAFLARNPNRVISKDELVQAVWGGAAISDDALTQTIRAVSKRIESRGIPESGLFMIHDARRAKEAAEMALSDDLRKRVVEAVTDGGMSRNAAAKRFGVSIASAVRWLHRFAATGEISPAPTGGDRRSDRIEAHRDYLLGLIRRQPDMTLLEIQERLIANCGERFYFIRDLALPRSP